MTRKNTLVVPPTTQTLAAVVEKDCEFEGKLCFRGTARIAGQFKGEIFSSDTLIIGETATVKANIEAGVVIIHGEVTGTIKAHYRVEIHKPASFKGEIYTPSLSVAEGVHFEGKSSMSTSSTVPGIVKISENPQTLKKRASTPES